MSDLVLYSVVGGSLALSLLMTGAALLVAVGLARESMALLARNTGVLERMTIDATDKAMAVCDHELERLKIKRAEEREDLNDRRRDAAAVAAANPVFAPGFNPQKTTEFPDPVVIGM